MTVFAALAISTVLINRERAKAEANFRKARAAVDTYFTTVSESRLLDVPGLQPLRKELLDSALEYYRDFLREHGDDSSVRKESAAASFRAGWITQMVGSDANAMESYRTAATLYEELVRAEPVPRSIGAIWRARMVRWRLRPRTSTPFFTIVARLPSGRNSCGRSPRTSWRATMSRAPMGTSPACCATLAQPEAALAALDSAAVIGEELVALPLDTVGTADEFTRRSDPWANVREDLAQIYLRRASILRETHRFDEADTAWQRSHASLSGTRYEPTDVRKRESAGKL